jgi:general secretion pathway protein C
MQNLKYHILNTISIIFFSYFTSISINQFFEFGLSPSLSVSQKESKVHENIQKPKSFDDYKVVLESGFFKIPSETDNVAATPDKSAENIKDLELLGTIAGPASIARAMIKKKTEKEPEIFKLWSEVYGYKLVRIDNWKVHLKVGENIQILEMYPKLEDTSQKNPVDNNQTSANIKQKQTLSRSEIKQNVFNNMDNALRGLRAGPYRVDGKIEGYKIFRIKPYNILYKYGARNGDIIKRVNGHPVDSTEKLYTMWQSLKGDAKITVDLDRGGKIITFDFSITD